MNCPNCGAETNESVCPVCGAAVGTSGGFKLFNCYWYDSRN